MKPEVITGKESNKEVYASLEVDITLNLYPPGSATDTIGNGLPPLKPGGTLVLMVGGSRCHPSSVLGVDASITVKGQFMYPPSAVPKMIGLVEAGLLDLNAYDERRRLEMDDVLEAVEFFEFSALKENRGWLYQVVLEA